MISYLNFVVVAYLLLNVTDGSVRAAMPAVAAASCPGVRAASVNVRRVVGLATGLIPRIHQSYSVYSIENRVLKSLKIVIFRSRVMEKVRRSKRR